ncbi:hypothetical protein IM697_00930 [Streptomyces ferrugineus]|uniref:Uncharacterized protein n=1 Tax=Streptomyces ferrugineus TaxID=1413221 RepID=A0A7M2SL25_9ACTN|nr:hypothetical protein [Streptomyces ferrugineus]QOV37070.1 hypothetical protein IM697_00930 [Streptomyces ferrugineus]
MSSTGAMTLPESEAPRQQPPPRRRTREITVGSVVTTLALSVLAGPSQNAGGRARP